MTAEEIKEILTEQGYEDTLVFENPDYSDAFIGHSSDGRAVYLFTKMVKSLMVTERMTEEDALDFIDYNTIRSLPYAGDKSPIIVFNDVDYEL